MKYKLVGIDIDGTLYEDGKIHDLNVSVINNLIEKGVEIVVITGRSPYTAIPCISELKLKTPIIGCNGAVSVDLQYNCIENIHIDTDSILKVYDFFTKQGIYPRFFESDKVYTFNPDEFDKEKNPAYDFSIFLKSVMPFGVLNDKSELLDKKIVKVVHVFENEEDIHIFEEKLSEVQGIDTFNSGNNCLDIVPHGVSKGNALLKYAEKLNISPCEIIAIGDSQNDIPMIKMAGLGIAMKNADPLLKEVCDFVTDSCHNAGVAKVLLKEFADIL